MGTVAGLFPGSIRNATDLRHQVMLSQFIYCSIHYDFFNPGHQPWFGIAFRRAYKLRNIAEQFYKPIIHHVSYTVVPVNVAERYFESVAIIPLVKLLLAFTVVRNTSSDYGMQIR